MLFILVVVLSIIAITILLILTRKNILTLKLNAKKIIIILLVFLLLYGCFKVFVKRYDIIFFFESLQYEYINDYDYSNDIVNNGYISKEGAIKIAKVNCELIENGTYINYDEAFKNILDNTSDTSNYKKQTTFWLITFTTGWDYAYGHEEE